MEIYFQYIYIDAQLLADNCHRNNGITEGNRK